MVCFCVTSTLTYFSLVYSTKVERRAEGAGLGMRGSRKRGTSDSYRVAVKQAAQQRFKEMQEAEQSM